MLPHAAFTRLLAAAPVVVTDGGSIQEECALLGVPTLLWRAETERGDGLRTADGGPGNVVLAAYDPGTVDAFLADGEARRRPPAHATSEPSLEILETLLARLAAP